MRRLHRIFQRRIYNPCLCTRRFLHWLFSNSEPISRDFLKWKRRRNGFPKGDGQPDKDGTGVRDCFHKLYRWNSLQHLLLFSQIHCYYKTLKQDHRLMSVNKVTKKECDDNLLNFHLDENGCNRENKTLYSMYSLV